MSVQDLASDRPSQEAIDKLNVIPVFVIAKSPSELCLSEQNGITIVPLYLSKKAADEALSAYQSAIPEFKASVVFFTLDKMYDIIQVFQEQYAQQSKQIVFPVVVKKENTQQALEILKKDGFDDSAVRSNLTIPVFYTEPVITIDSSNGNGPQKVFFIDYSSLQEAISNLPESTNPPVVKVANLDQVIDMISESSDKNFAFYPTSEFYAIQKILEGSFQLQS